MRKYRTIKVDKKIEEIYCDVCGDDITNEHISRSCKLCGREFCPKCVKDNYHIFKNYSTTICKEHKDYIKLLIKRNELYKKYYTISELCDVNYIKERKKFEN